jgi:hypothetical protein
MIITIVQDIMTIYTRIVSMNKIVPSEIADVVVSTNSSRSTDRWTLELMRFWIRQNSTMNFRHVTGKKKMLSNNRWSGDTWMLVRDISGMKWPGITPVIAAEYLREVAIRWWRAVEDIVRRLC